MELSIALSLSDCFGPKKETSILARVAKLLLLSIFETKISLQILGFLVKYINIVFFIVPRER